MPVARLSRTSRTPKPSTPPATKPCGCETDLFRPLLMCPRCGAAYFIGQDGIGVAILEMLRLPQQLPGLFYSFPGRPIHPISRRDERQPGHDLAHVLIWCLKLLQPMASSATPEPLPELVFTESLVCAICGGLS